MCISIIHLNWGRTLKKMCKISNMKKWHYRALCKSSMKIFFGCVTRLVFSVFSHYCFFSFIYEKIITYGQGWLSLCGFGGFLKVFRVFHFFFLFQLDGITSSRNRHFIVLRSFKSRCIRYFNWYFRTSFYRQTRSKGTPCLNNCCHSFELT